MESLWILIDIAAPIALIAVIIWVFLRNRRPRPGEIAKAEQGARDLRREIEAEETRDGAP